MQRLGWVLIHFIWQGAGIALLLALALRLLSQASSQIRYAVIAVALLVAAAMPVVTWAVLGSAIKPALTLMAPTPSTVLQPIRTPSNLVEGSPVELVQGASHLGKTSWKPDLAKIAAATLPYVVGLWLAGVLVLMGRLILGWIWSQRLCHAGSPIRELECLERFGGLLKRMRVTVPVRLLQSVQIEVPTLIGWLRPTILIPVSVLSGLNPEQLEAILAHELAHVRRYDYLVNLFQTVVETILFYHPAIWWISRKLREERENSCDDIVLELMQDRLVYASALALLEEVRPAFFALTASGGSLLDRINRIARSGGPRSSLTPVVITALIVGFVAVPLVGQMVIAKVKTGGGVDPTLTASLVAAAKQGDVAKVEGLIKHGADPNATLKADGMNALLAAVNHDRIDVVKLLLRNGADPNCKLLDRDDVFALSYAKNAAMVKVLLNAGADPNGKNDLAPLMDAPDPESVRLLVQYGAKLNPKFSDGRSLLENAVGNELYERSLGDRWDVIAELIKQGAEFDPRSNGPTLLVLAAGEGKINIARGLIDSGVSPDAYATRGIFLISPLTEAAFARSPDMIRLLLSRGAHVSDWRGSTSPLSMALDSGRFDNVDILRQAGENDVGYLSEYCARGNLTKVNELIKAGANVNETDKYGVTPLMYAIRQGHPEIIRVLWDHGANINQFDSAGNTPLTQFQAVRADFDRWPGAIADDWGIHRRMRANEAKQRITDLESFFKQHASDPNYQNASGRTALHQAALAGNTEGLSRLLALKPDINLEDNNGGTPLLLAASSALANNLSIRYVDARSAKQWNAEARIADQLIKAGAKLDLVVSNGKTVGELAIEAANKSKNQQLISVLRLSPSHSSGNVTASTYPPDVTAPRFQNVVVSGKLRLVHPELVDLAKSDGYLQNVDGGTIEFHFQPDGEYTIPELKPGVYNRHIHFVPADPTVVTKGADRSLAKAFDDMTLSAEAIDMTLAPVTIDGSASRMTMNLDLEVPIPAKPKGSIEIGLKVIEISDDAYLANKTQVDAAVEKADIGFFNNREGVSLLSAPSVTTEPGLQADVDIVRRFPYPIKFDPAVRVSGPGPTPSGAIIPMTPTDFATKDVGIQAEITPSINSAKSPEPGKIVLNGKISVTNFDGFTNSNVAGVPGMPSFTTNESLFLEQLGDHELKGLWIPGEHVAQRIPDYLKLGPQLTTPLIKSRYLLFVSASLAK
jgi:ankyrin repeat protein/beta-lactamase regulating signal transducer with metallopeptidase domain